MSAACVARSAVITWVGFGVWGLGLGGWGLGFRVQGSGFRVWGLGLGVQGLGFDRLDRERELLCVVDICLHLQSPKRIHRVRHTLSRVQHTRGGVRHTQVGVLDTPGGG